MFLKIFLKIEDNIQKLPPLSCENIRAFCFVVEEDLKKCYTWFTHKYFYLPRTAAVWRDNIGFCL